MITVITGVLGQQSIITENISGDESLFNKMISDIKNPKLLLHNENKTSYYFESFEGDFKIIQNGVSK
ncbi:hypothetical protein [Methanococcus maripaludis]|uniref:Uncharacterized protein n=1 Tax=Methanococcus maripaludis TaxID=39152 RepID=A0A7J9PP00_METMI|nr:hypothetical protein [Methanococcus maripaludis]MBA2864446.1 hypothetical protein [Methanococcus maripaludis]